MKRYVQEVATSLLLCCVVWYNRRRRVGLLTSVEGLRYAKGPELFRSRWSSVGKLTSCTDLKVQFPAGARVDSSYGLVWNKILALFFYLLHCQLVFIFLVAFAELRKWLWASSCQSVRPSTRNNSASTRRSCKKFSIWGFFENLSRKLSFTKIGQE
jgi:hypothetical protein